MEISREPILRVSGAAAMTGRKKREEERERERERERETSGGTHWDSRRISK